jgi:SAM-dependent methyltransferase
MALGSSDASVGPLKNIIPLLGSATGVVLDVGPGDGRQLKLYTSPVMKIIYGAEPCEILHPALKEAAEKAGLGGKYRILTCGGQRQSLYPKLRELGIMKEGPVFDTIVCSKVLCSVPCPEDTVAGLYDLLKPGGKFIICEHVKNPWRTRKGSVIARLIQLLYTLHGWTFFLGGCHLGRNTDEIVKAAANKDGGWDKVDLENAVAWGTIPYVLGELVKKS